MDSRQEIVASRKQPLNQGKADASSGKKPARKMHFSTSESDHEKAPNQPTQEPEKLDTPTAEYKPPQVTQEEAKPLESKTSRLQIKIKENPQLAEPSEAEEDCGFPHYSSSYVKHLRFQQGHRQSLKKLQQKFELKSQVSWSQFKKEEKEEKLPPGTEIIDKIIEDDIKNFQIQRPFQRGQYHQCIPNPHSDKQGELITVQMLSMWALDYADPKKSVNEMESEGHDPASQICQYELRGENKKKILNILGKKVSTALRQEGLDRVEEGRVKKLDHASKLEIKEKDENAQISKVQSDGSGESACKQYNQYAVIGFWKMDQNDEFFCYHYFHVPNPVAREFAKSERKSHINEDLSLSLTQILFEGAGNELFMIFNPSDVAKKDYVPADKKSLRLGILNLNVPQSHSPFTKRSYKKTNAFSSEFLLPEHGQKIKKEIESKLTKSKPNPMIFRRKRPANTSIQEVNDMLDDGTVTVTQDDSQQQTILVVPDGKYLDMYSLESERERVFKANLEGDVFLKYNSETDEISYLAGLSKKSTVKGTPKAKTGDSKSTQSPEAQQCLIRLKLSEDPKQTPLSTDKTRLNFQNVELHLDEGKKGMILKAYMHNQDKRFTIIREGFQAITMEQILLEGTLQYKVKFYIQSEVCRGIFLRNHLFIESGLRSPKQEIVTRNNQKDTFRLQLMLHDVSCKDQSISARYSQKPIEETIECIEEEGEEFQNETEQSDLKDKEQNEIIQRVNTESNKDLQSFRSMDKLSRSFTQRAVHKKSLSSETLRSLTPRSSQQKRRQNSLALSGGMSIQPDYDSDSSDDGDGGDFHPRKKIILELLLSSNLYDSGTSESRFFASIMPMSIQKLDKKDRNNDWRGNEGVAAPRYQVTGSAVFEDMETGDVHLCIMRSLDQDRRQFYPQQAAKQDFIVDYPILAYKAVSPDNKSIVLCHLAHNIPQRQVYLNDWEFLQFVHGNFEDFSIRKQIVMIVRNRAQGLIKLLTVFIDPWKDIKFDSEFDVPENFYISTNIVAQPKESKNDPLRTFSFYNIKKASFVPMKPMKDKIVSLILQYSHSIFSVSINSSNYRRLTSPGKMTQEYMIVGSNDGIFYAENDLDRSSIFMIELFGKTMKIKNREIYQMSSQVIAFNTDNSNESIQSCQQSIFVLGQDQKLLHLKESTSSQDNFQCVGVFDFTQYDLRGLIQNNWTESHMSTESITFDEYVFRVNASDQSAEKGQDCFFWADKKHVSEHGFKYWDLDSKPKEVVFERIKVQQITNSTSMIAIGREPKRKQFYECGSWFRVRPGNSNREYSVIAEERCRQVQDGSCQNDCSHMAFVTNRHTLIQFRFDQELDDDSGGVIYCQKRNLHPQKKEKTIIFNTQGVIVHQQDQVQKYLDQKIVGESELKYGRKYITTMKSDKKEKTATMALLLSQPNGRIDWVLEIFDYTNWIKENLNECFKENQQHFLADSILEGVTQDELIETQLDNIEKEKKKLEKLTEEKKSNFVKNKQIKAIEKEQDILVDLENCINPKKRAEILLKNITFYNKVFISRGNGPREKRLLKLIRVRLPEQLSEPKNDQKGKKLKKEQVKYSLLFHDLKINEEWKLTVVIVLSNEENIFQNLQCRLAGDYFCYRHYTEKVIKFKSLKEQTKEHQIDLENFLPNKQSIKFITFDGLKKQSYLRFKEHHFQKLTSSEGQQEPGHLLNVSIQNSCYIFNLDKHIELESQEDFKAFEEHFIDSTDQLLCLNHLVDTGFYMTSVTRIQKSKLNSVRKPKLQKILTNEQVSLYFAQETQKKDVDSGTLQIDIKRKNYTNVYFGNMHRTHSYLDLLGLHQIKIALMKGQEFFVPDQTILSVYAGHTIFSIFLYNSQVLEQIYSQVKSRPQQDTLDEYKNPTEDAFFRRLYSIIMMPTSDNIQDEHVHKAQLNQQSWCKSCLDDAKSGTEGHQYFKDVDQEKPEDCRCKGFYPQVMKSIHFENTRIRDLFIKILMHCERFEITSLTSDIKDMQRLIKSYNPLLGKAFDEKCFTTNFFCKNIQDLDIKLSCQSKGQKQRVILSRISALKRDEIQKKIEDLCKEKKTFFYKYIFSLCKKEKMSHTIDVDIKLIRTDWLFTQQNVSVNGNDFLQLIDTLDESDNQALYTTNFVDALLETIYTQRRKVFNYVFLPFMLQSAACLIYFSLYLQHEEPEFSLSGLFLQLCIVVSTIYFVYQEGLQIKDKELLEYFWDLNNIFDLTSSFLNWVLVLNEWVNHYLIDSTNLKICTMFAIVGVWYKVFYWMRLFQNPAFFMNLLKQTLKDIVPFMLMISILIAGFANILFILNLVDLSASEEEQAQQKSVIAQISSFDFINAFIHMYNLAIGEYDTDNFDNKGTTMKVFLWFVFLSATFMLQVVFMNMLIAIMSNTFEEVMEVKHQSAIEERITILNDFRLFLDKFSLNMGAQYMFVIKPSKTNMLEDSLENQLEVMKEQAERQTKRILQFQAKQSEEHAAKFEAIQSEMYQMNDSIDRKVSHVVALLSQVIENQNYGRHNRD